MTVSPWYSSWFASPRMLGSFRPRPVDARRCSLPECSQSFAIRSQVFESTRVWYLGSFLPSSYKQFWKLSFEFHIWFFHIDHGSNPHHRGQLKSKPSWLFQSILWRSQSYCGQWNRRERVHFELSFWQLHHGLPSGFYLIQPWDLKVLLKLQPMRLSCSQASPRRVAKTTVAHLVHCLARRMIRTAPQLVVQLQRPTRLGWQKMRLSPSWQQRLFSRRRE